MDKLIKQAFTLIELLVVIAIIGILSGLIVVSMGGMTQKATIAKAQIFSSSLKNSLMLNLVSEWKFDGPTSDGSLVTANDLLDTWSNINNGVIGSYPATVKTNSNCISGSCLQFDGIDDITYFGNNSSLSMGTGDATISFWVKFNNAVAGSEAETMIMTGAGDSGTGKDGYWIYRIGNGSALRLNFTDGSAEQVIAYLSAPGSLVANNWYNITIVFDRNVSAFAYINGVKQIGYSLDITPQQGDVQNTQSLRFGAWAYNFDRLAGKMDEVRLYNSAMPTSQVQEQYYARINRLLANGSISQEEYASRINSSAKAK